MMWLAVFLLVFVGGIAQELLSRKARIIRRMAATRPTSIEQLDEGQTRLIGTAHAIGDLLVAPVTGRPCLAYELVLEQWNGESTQELTSLRGARPFRLLDRTGDTEVHPNEDYELDLIRQGHSDILDTRSWERLRSILVSKGFLSDDDAELAGTDPDRDQPLRWIFSCREGRIEQGERITVFGRAVREVRPDGMRRGFRQPPEVVSVGGTVNEPVLISNDPVFVKEAGGQSPALTGSPPPPLGRSGGGRSTLPRG